MMELSVMGFVTTIFEWVVQCINGGLLNVLFEVEFNSTTNENTYKFKLNQDKLLQYFKAMVLMNGENLPLDVLKSFPVDIEGGEIGVKFARENPNREAVLLIGPLVAAILMLLGVLGLLLVICCACGGKCCCGKPKARRPKKSEKGKEGEEPIGLDDYNVNTEFDNGYDGYAFYSQPEDKVEEDNGSSEGLMNNIRGLFTFYSSSVYGSKKRENDEKMMEKISEVVESSQILRENQGHLCCACHILTLILAVAYVVGLITCVVVYFMAAQEMTTIMTQPPADSAILKNEVMAWLSGNSSQYNLQGTVSFILEETANILTTGIDNLTATVNTTLDNLDVWLKPTIDNGTSKIFTEMKTLTNLDQIFTGSEKIAKDMADLLKNIKVIEDNYNATIGEAIQLNASFRLLYEQIKAEKNCQSISSDKLDALLFNYDATAVLYPVFANNLTLLVSYFIDFAKKIADVQKELDRMPGELADQVISKLDFTNITNELNNTVSNLLGTFQQEILPLRQTISTYIEQARPYISPAVYVLGGLMVIITLAFFTCIVLFVFEAFVRHIFSPTGKGPSKLAGASNIRRTSCVCGGCRFLISSLLFIIVIIISLVAAAVLVVCTFFAAELCPYISNQTGVNQTDYVLNSIISKEWPQLQDDKLDIPAPRNVLYAIGTTCKPTDGRSPMLLPTVGIDNFVNFTALATGSDLDNYVNNVIEKLSEGISDQIKSEMVEQIKNMSQSFQFLSQLLTAFNAVGAVKELNKFVNADVTKLNSLKADLDSCSATLSSYLTGNISKLQGAQPKIELLRDAYQGVANHQNIHTDLEQYVNMAERSLEKLRNRAQLQQELDQNLKPMIRDLFFLIFDQCTNEANGIVNKVLPCSDMHYVFDALVATGCSSSGLLRRFAGWSLALMLTIILSFLCLMGTFNLWCIQSHQIKRFFGS